MRHIRRFIYAKLRRIGISPTDIGTRRWWLIMALVGIAADTISLITFGRYCCHWRGDVMFGRTRFAQWVKSLDPDS